MPEPDEVSLFVERLNAVGAQYMVTGATAAILYGQPRVTNDLDVVLDLREEHVSAVVQLFPPEEFYLPPESVIRVEKARSLRGHFNIIHHESGYKADVYLAGEDPFHTWAFARRRRIEWTGGLFLFVAPPEYVVIRKLEFFREGGSTKHLIDIAALRKSTELDPAALEEWARKLGVEELWGKVMRERT